MVPTVLPAVVLVAEDDPDLRALVEVVLHGAGYRVVAVEDGEQAVHLAVTVAACLLVLDVRMPGVGGLDVCRTVKSQPSRYGCAVLLMSSGASPEEVAAGFAAGADDFLPKPFTPADLLLRVGRLLETAA
jgi:DNA-binding response OmpR family regulator